MQVPALHGHSHDEATQEQHISVLHVLDTHLEGGGMESPSGLPPGHTLFGPRATQDPRDRRADQMLTPGTVGSGMRGQVVISMPKRIRSGILWSSGAWAAQRAPSRGASGKSRRPPGFPASAHLPGVQNLEEWEKQDRHEGGDRQRDDFCAPVNGHEDDDVGTPDELKRQP